MFVSESRYKQQTHVIQTDFTEGHSIYSAIAQQLEGLQIGILGKIKIKNEVQNSEDGAKEWSEFW